MRIVVIANTVDSRKTGMGRCIHYLKDEWMKRGHEIHIIFSSDVPPLPTSRLRHWLFPLMSLWSLKNLWQKYGRPDVVNIHSTDAFWYVLLRRFFKNLPPCVLISYGSDEMRWNLEKEEETLGFHKIRLLSHLYYPFFVILPLRFSVKHADLVKTASREENRFYKDRYKMSEEKIAFVPNGVSEEFFVLPRNYDRPARRILYVGGWEWRKGIKDLAAGFQLAAKDFPDLTLTLAGTGKTRAEVLKIFPAELHTRIEVRPSVDAEQMPLVYSTHDLFLFPSLFESMSLVVPEAMASGMPIITTQTCGMQDVIQHEKNGLLVPVRHANAVAENIKRLCHHPDLCRQLGIQAREDAKKIRWALVAQQEIEKFYSLLKKENIHVPANL